MTESAMAHPTQSLKFETTAFSPDWKNDFTAGDVGCEEARGSFVWRPQGFGSNINSEFLLARRRRQEMHDVRLFWWERCPATTTVALPIL